jgi:ring-1,2-phenylacetyl-CoA epoxidase subunit PaaE
MSWHEAVYMEVEVVGEKKELQVLPGETILEACMREGIEVPFSCRSGACQSCKGELSSGKVQMETNEVLSEDEVRQGYVLCCQAKPTSSERIKVRYIEEP